MKLRNVYLLAAIVLSICSKILQLQFDSIWGDVLVLPAAVFFVLSVLLFIPKYTVFLNNSMSRKKAKAFALFCCLTVLFFQLFMLITIGKSHGWVFAFIIPFLIFGGLSIYNWKYITKTE